MQSLVEHHCIEWNNQTLLPNSSAFQLSTTTYFQPLQPSKTQTPVCHLIAGIYPNEIYVMSTTRKSYICSTHNEIFTLILRYLQCSLSFKKSPANFGGQRHPNGTWNGILALFDTKQADFIPHIFSTTNHRDAIIQYRSLLPAKELITMLSYSRWISSDSLGNFFSSFSSSIWCLTGVFYLLYGALNWKERIGSEGEGNRYADVRSCVINYLEMFALLIGQGSVHLTPKPQKQLRNPLILWILFSFILRTLFANFITAFLLSRTQLKLDYFHQLAHHHPSSKLKILIVRKSSSHYFFKQNFPKLVRQIETISYEENNSIDTLRKVQQGSYVLIAPREFGEMIQSYYSMFRFHVSREGVYSALGNFAMRHGLREDVSRRLGQLWRDIFAFGLNTKLDKTIFMNNLLASLRSKCATLQTLTRKTEKSLRTSGRLQSFRTYLYLYLIGITVSFVFFTTELIITNLCRQKYIKNSKIKKEFNN